MAVAGSSRSATGLKIERILRYVLDEKEFLAPHGIRSLSKYHLAHPCVFSLNGRQHTVRYRRENPAVKRSPATPNWHGVGVVPDEHPPDQIAAEPV